MNGIKSNRAIDVSSNDWQLGGGNKMRSFHHLGIASKSILVDIASLTHQGYQVVSELIEDPLQGVRVQFMEGGGPRIELVTPLNPSSPGPLAAIFASNIKIYHWAFEVPDIDIEIARLREARCRLISPCKPAVAFDGRSIAFLIQPNSMLLELISAT
jgi:methylmalonyl-CoA/ethylmalonyl-CoA epimerase